jgi:hypothetical protein
MSDNLIPTPVPLPVEPPLKKPRSSQDQAKANLISTRYTSLIAIQGQLEATRRLAPRGYDTLGLAEGITICTLCQEKFNARQLAMEARDGLGRRYRRTNQDVHDFYAEFARIASKAFKDNPEARAAVVIPARELRDQERFLTNVTVAYTAALTRSTYLAILSKRGYTQEVLQAALTSLQNVRQLSADFANEQGNAILATRQRDEAIKALNVWWREFNATAQVAFKDRPDLLKLLEE